MQAIHYSCNPTNVAKIKKDLPILFVSGECDPVGDNGEGVKKSFDITQDHFYEQYGKKIRYFIYKCRMIINSNLIIDICLIHVFNHLRK